MNSYRTQTKIHEKQTDSLDRLRYTLTSGRLATPQNQRELTCGQHGSSLTSQEE